MYKYRQNTNKLLELIDEGLLDSKEVLYAALSWHSDSDVGEMAVENEFFSDEDCDEDSNTM